MSGGCISQKYEGLQEFRFLVFSLFCTLSFIKVLVTSVTHGASWEGGREADTVRQSGTDEVGRTK